MVARALSSRPLLIRGISTGLWGTKVLRNYQEEADPLHGMHGYCSVC